MNKSAAPSGNSKLKITYEGVSGGAATCPFPVDPPQIRLFEKLERKEHGTQSVYQFVYIGQLTSQSIDSRPSTNICRLDGL